MLGTWKLYLTSPKNLINSITILSPMHKRGFISFMIATVLSFPLVLAGPLDILGSVWQKILSIGSLSFIGVSGVVPLTRILIWILIFIIIFATIAGLGKGGGEGGTKPFSYFTRTQGIVVAAVLATVTAIFLPPSVLLATGTGWATIIALILIGGPIVGLGYLVLTYPGKGQDTKGTVLMKLVLCFLLFWILSAMKNAAVL